MQFVHNEEQQLIRQSARSVLSARAGSEALQAALRAPAGYDAALWRTFGELGWTGLAIPQAYGGAGLGYVDYVLAIEELSAVDGSVGITVAAHNSLGTNHIFLAGNEQEVLRIMCPRELVNPKIESRHTH